LCRSNAEYLGAECPGVEGGASWSQSAHEIAAAGECRYWKAIADGFTEGRKVRNDIYEVLAAMNAVSKAREDLIEHEHDAVFTTEVAERPQKRLIERDTAGTVIDRRDNSTCQLVSMIAEDPFKQFLIVQLPDQRGLSALGRSGGERYGGGVIARAGKLERRMHADAKRVVPAMILALEL
jgi:hypothetical protein